MGEDQVRTTLGEADAKVEKDEKEQDRHNELGGLPQK